MIDVPREWTTGPTVPYPEASFPEVVLAQAARRPDAVAVRQWADQLTYAELVDAAGRLAGQLRELGVEPEVPVAVCLRRRPEAVVAILGVMLAGGVHLPLELDHPPRRLREIVTDAGVTVGVVDTEGRDLLSDLVSTCLAVPLPGSAGPAVTACPAGPDDAAYVLYTSGSTGRPKGVVVTHRSLVAYLAGLVERFGLTEDVVSVSFSSFGFDAFVGDLLMPLTIGGQAVLLSEADRGDPERAHRFINQHGATFGILTAALLPVLDPAATPGWSTVLAGGEVMPPSEVARWAMDGRRFVNVYGPTETTVCVTCVEVSGEWTEPVPIGAPFPNHHAYVVDADLRQVPVGERGELLIGGVGVARGYLGRPEITAERFGDDPFIPGGRVYRTGDLASWRSDGTLAFHGRMDRQIKIRGQRLEIGEVEETLRTHPAVRQATVDVLDGPRGKELVAFVAPVDAPEAEALRAHCADRLPPYMVPARVLHLATLPINPAGKLDMAALHALAASADDTADQRADEAGMAAPDAVAAAVRRAWSAILGTTSAGPDDDFFGHGGHSIAAMRLAVRLRGDLDRAVAVEDVFAGRTLAGLTERVATAPPTDAELTRGGPPRLSPAQRRLWFLDRLAPGSTAYNVPLAERLRGPLDVDALRAALRAVATRHDVLRWRIPHERGEPYAVVDPVSDVPLAVVDVAQAELGGALAAFAREPFSLSAGPLWRARLYRLGVQEQVLAMSLHHAVFDGWSQAPLYRDLAAAYGRALSNVDKQAAPGGDAGDEPARYADYVAWRAERDRRRGEADLGWWREHLAGAPHTLDLPRDRPRPAVQTYAGAEAHTALDAETTARVRDLAGKLGATPAMTLGAAFGYLLGRLTGATEVVFGTPTADRRHTAFADLVGFFIEVVPIRLPADPEATFADQVRACRDEMLDALAHPAAPLERVVDALRVPRAPSRAPLVQVLFNAYNFPEPRLALPGVAAEPVPVAMPGSPFDLTAYLVERDGRFAIDALYNPDLYDAARVEELLAAYLALVEQVSAAPFIPMGQARLPISTGRSGQSWPAGEADQAAVPVRQPPVGDLRLGHTEQLVADVWRAVLGVDTVGRTENFFEIGGTSVALVAVQMRLTEALRRPVSVVDVFRFPTVRALAGYLDGATDDTAVTRAAQRAALRRERRGAARRD